MSTLGWLEQAMRVMHQGGMRIGCRDSAQHS